MDGVDAFARHLALAERRDGSAAVRILPLLDGDDPFGGDLEARGYVVASDETPATTALGFSPEYDTTSVRVVQTSLVSPTGAYDVALGDGTRTLRKRQIVRGGYDPTALVSARLWVTARDGVEIPVSIVHRRDLLDEGGVPGDAPREPMPLLLYGYGSYEVSIDPVFSSARLSLLDRGIGFAIAHVRGGGELGRSWYEAGRLEHKVTTFLDFVDVARALVARGFSSPPASPPRGLGGGLLMGASINLDPWAFRAVVAEVPFVDVLSTMLDASIPLTVGEWEEWGDPLHDEAAYRRMKAWSPYDNVVGRGRRVAAAIPTCSVLGSLNDTRVQYWEPAKWVAKLRAANPSNRIVLKTDLGAGHAGPSGRYDSWRERALVFAWIADRLGSDDARAAGLRLRSRPAPWRRRPQLRAVTGQARTTTCARVLEVGSPRRGAACAVVVVDGPERPALDGVAGERDRREDRRRRSRR